MLAVLSASLFSAFEAHAQDPSTLAPSVEKSSSFPKQSMVGPSRNIDKSQPLYLQGDELIYDTGGNKVIARGNVEIYYNNYILTADQVVYDQSANTLTAVGNVVLKEPNGNIVRADRYTLTDDFRDGFVSQLSIVASDDTRIAAQHATRRGGNTTVFTNGRFTPCKTTDGMPPLWCLSAATVTHDQAAATISYQDAYFELFGVPILYTPYFEHADPSVKRKSGFLMPQPTVSDNLGYSTTIPYYFALAPNYDFTFYPMYTSRQGILWQGDWRHRTENGQYYIKGAGIDQDAADLPSAIANRDQYDGWRGSVETKGLFNLGSWWKLGWDVTMESDDEFRRFYKIDNALLTDRVNEIFLAGLSDRSYFKMSAYEFTDLGFTTPGTSETKQYAYPIMDYNYVFADPIVGGELTWTTNALALSSNQDPTAFAPFADTNQQMNRVVTELNWRRRLTDHIGITYTPFAQLRADAYQISNFFDPFDPTAPLQETSFARALALGGVTVAYPWVANTARGSHVIEPIGQIIGRQASIKQDGLPNEDAQSLIFDDTNLFEVTKFSGYDRIETGTRANVGLQYTFQSNGGGYTRILAGESYQLAGTNAYADPSFDVNGNPVFTPDSGLQTDRSDYVLGAYVAPWTFLQLISQSRFDQSSFALARQDAGAQLNLGPLSANAVYAYLNTDPTNGIDTAQEDVYSGLNLRLTDRWSVGAAVRYDIDDDTIASDMFQVRYGDECFVLTATYTDNYYVNPDIVDGQTLMVRFELKHLGEFGYSTDVLSGTSISEQQSGG
ncbi:MAG TPA: LPS-assembly protein LptD [Hyphomicrobium sp.]|jgi:LPS-assembly protein